MNKQLQILVRQRMATAVLCRTACLKQTQLTDLQLHFTVQLQTQAAQQESKTLSILHGTINYSMEQSPSSEADSLRSRHFLSFMELEGSLPCSQEPATGSYPESQIFILHF
jgi:hypothetical protein